MKLPIRKLEIIKDGLGYAVMFAKTESETAEFALMKMEIEKAIIEEKDQEIRIAQYKSLSGCPFHYCDSNPKCKEKCRYA